MERHQRLSCGLPNLMFLGRVVDAGRGVSVSMAMGELRDGVTPGAVVKVAETWVVAVELNEMMFHTPSLSGLKPQRIGPGGEEASDRPHKHRIDRGP